jgi:hypothetical protein
VIDVLHGAAIDYSHCCKTFLFLNSVLCSLSMTTKHTLLSIIKILKKGLNNSKRLILSNIKKTYQFLCRLRFRIRDYPSGFVFLPKPKPCCQECKSQLQLWKYKALREQWIVEEYKVRFDKEKCCVMLDRLVSQEALPKSIL